MPDDLHRSQYRLPHDLFEQLKRSADQAGRSVNAELVERLQQSFGDGEERMLKLIEEGCRRALARLD